MIWYFIAAIMLIIGIGIAFVGHKDSFGLFCTSITLIVVGFCICLATGEEQAKYNRFEKTIEYQRETYETIENKNDAYVVVDILEANKQLSEYKAKKDMYGIFSVVPNDVYNIKPIGVSQ